MKNVLNNHTLHRQIGLFSAMVLVVANMVGTGIFTTSGFVMSEVGSPQAMLLAWFVGGVFALCGALCYGELGAMYPRAGGEYVFLRESFGKAAAFVSGWVSLIVGFSAPIAAAAIAFATYFFRLWGAGSNGGLTITSMNLGIIKISPITTLAILIIVLFSFVHYHSLVFGARVQNVLTVFKITLIVFFAGAGFFVGHGSAEHFFGHFEIGSVLQEKFAVSLIFVSFAYSGWNAAAYLGGEIKKPGKNIPLALFAGTLIVTCLYLVLNVLYIYALSPQEMSGVLEVGASSAEALFGSRLGGCFTGAIALGLLSVLSAMIMAGPRVYYAMARDGVFFELFGRVNKLHRTPAHAIFLQSTIAIFMVLTASFEKLLIYIGFTLSLCAALTVIGMVKLRRGQPGLNRGYKTFGYPVTPLIFILGNMWIIYFSIKSQPTASLIGLGTIGLGLAVFCYFIRKSAIRNGQSPSKAVQ